MDTSKILIINENEIKNDSRIEVTADDKTLRELIVVTQETKLNPILGDTLYLSVLTSIYNNVQNSITIPANIVNLLPFIKKYLLYQVIADFIYVNHYKLTNKGTVKLSDSNATSASNSDIEWYKNHYDNAASSYKKKLVDYLSINGLTTESNVDDDYSFRGIYMDIAPNCGSISNSVSSSGFQGYQGFQGSNGSGNGGTNNYIKIVPSVIGLAYTILSTDDLVSVNNQISPFTDEVYVLMPDASICEGKIITVKLYDNTSLDVSVFTNGELIENTTGAFNGSFSLNISGGIYRHSWISNGTDWEMVS